MGAISGMIETYEPPKPLSIEMPEKPKWNGVYYQGTREENNNLLLASSKMFNVEMSYWHTSKGYYFEPIQGEAYSYDYDPVTVSMLDYNIAIGYQSNSIKSTYRYTYVENNNGSLYLQPNIFQVSKVYSKVHTHPRSSPPGASDLRFSYLFGIRIVLGWDGSIYNYGGYRYWNLL